MSQEIPNLNVSPHQDKREEEQISLLHDDQQQTISTSQQISEHENPDDEDDIEKEEDLEYHASTLIAILKPVSITMLLVVVAVRTVTSLSESSANVLPTAAYNESPSDSNTERFLGSILNALIFLASILVTTVAFVLLYKYRCLKVIYGWLIFSSFLLLAAFGGFFLFLLAQSWNLPLDFISFSFMLWNFSLVGIVVIFWHGPTLINQSYLVAISALLAIFFTRIPEWTTFAILAFVAIYDLFAVLCPRGPLKVLVETAQKRQEPIPALLYNASVFFFMADKESQTSSATHARKGVKLGLGDFVFYSVLIGRAALFDMITVFTCFVAIVTGLFITLLLLAIFRKALPALPISIALGLIFYFFTRMFLLPFVIKLGQNQIFV